MVGYIKSAGEKKGIQTIAIYEFCKIYNLTNKKCFCKRVFVHCTYHVHKVCKDTYTFIPCKYKYVECTYQYTMYINNMQNMSKKCKNTRSRNLYAVQ